MSDNEGPLGGGGTNSDDLNLPKATVAKLVTDHLPNDLVCGKDVKEFLGDCLKEFILLVSSEANEICEKDSKKTILPEHLTSALKSLGFDSYVDQVSEVASEHKQQSKETKARKGNKMAASGMTEEELLRVQEQLFAGSKARYEAAAAEQ
ncbi:histone-fold-containing protein [Cystobasidium minutum MCA 4210]|uniref:histone-fold-containing protein n=1 Tax=Cystobasidium minutum MCA 4210 TaxID=1397322 RepID=UPI0034CE9C89|eukprot:jgi/Rhomi1/170494/fgenesh1_kg.4_\